MLHTVSGFLIIKKKAYPFCNGVFGLKPKDPTVSAIMAKHGVPQTESYQLTCRVYDPPPEFQEILKSAIYTTTTRATAHLPSNGTDTVGVGYIAHCEFKTDINTQAVWADITVQGIEGIKQYAYSGVFDLQKIAGHSVGLYSQPIVNEKTKKFFPQQIVDSFTLATANTPSPKLQPKIQPKAPATPTPNGEHPIFGETERELNLGD